MGALKGGQPNFMSHDPLRFSCFLMSGMLPFKPQNCIETYSCSINTVHCHYYLITHTTPSKPVLVSSIGKYSPTAGCG
jgi:hypothetical protein